MTHGRVWCHFCLLPALVSRQRKHQDTQPRAYPPSQHHSPVSTRMTRDVMVTCISNNLPDLSVPSPCCPHPVRCISLNLLISPRLCLKIPANSNRTHSVYQALLSSPSPSPLLHPALWRREPAGFSNSMPQSLQTDFTVIAELSRLGCAWCLHFTVYPRCHGFPAVICQRLFPYPSLHPCMQACTEERAVIRRIGV